MKTTRKFSFHDFIIYSIVLSSCFVLSGCSSKDDDGKTSEPAASIESLQKEIVKLRTENDELQHSLAGSRDKIEKQEMQRLKQENADSKKALAQATEKTEEQVGSELLNEQRQRLKQENADLKKPLAQATEKTEEQDNSELYAKVERLEQENNESKKLLDEKIAENKSLTTLASLKSRRIREGQYKKQAETVIAEFDSNSNVSSRRKLELIDSLAEMAAEQHMSVIDVVQKTLDSSDPDPEAGRAAIALLEDYETTEILPVIRQALESKDEQIRIGALTPLANVNDPRVIDLLVEALNDTSEGVRSAALEAAGQHPSVIDIVQKTLDDPDLDPEVVSAAIALLEDNGTTEILPVISQALESEDEQIRLAALEALANVDDPEEVIDLLVETLDDPSEEVRIAALEAAREQFDEIQRYVLEKGLNSFFADVKAEALSLLQDRSNHVSVEIIAAGLLDEDPEFREKVNIALSLFVNQRFETYETAIAWWNQNKYMYDENMFEIE